MNLSTYTNFLNTILKGPQQVMSASWSDRKEVLDQNVNLYCWQRTPDLEIRQYLEKVLITDPKPIRVEVNSEELVDQLRLARSSWEGTVPADGTRFWKDVSLLVGDFLQLSSSRTATMHLKVISDNACTKFHTDGYSLRLFSTYLGRGTEWIPESATNRLALGKSNKSIVKDTSKIQQMKPFEVGILKGELRNGLQQVTKGIVHRSPEIVTLNEKRIILRVDI